MVGSIRSASAIPPASAENRPIGITTSPYAATPTTIEGTPDSTSAV